VEVRCLTLYLAPGRKPPSCIFYVFLNLGLSSLLRLPGGNQFGCTLGRQAAKLPPTHHLQAVECPFGKIVMKKVRDYDYKDKLVSAIVPITGAALFAIISVVSRVLKGEAEALLTPAHFFETALHSAAGALISTTLFIARYMISMALLTERRYLHIPWNTDSTSARIQEKKIEIARTIQDIFFDIDGTGEQNDTKTSMLAMINFQLQEQRLNFINIGKLQFISQSFHVDTLHDSSQRTGTYGIIMDVVRRGDRIIATDFQNSKYWWLSKKVAFDFLRLNLDFMRRGAKIERVFGINHPLWEEDEQRKVEMIELLSNIRGMDIYTIDYKDFRSERGLFIEPIDCLVLMRGQSPLPGIEWLINQETGDTDKIYYVFKHGALRRIVSNFGKIMSSKEKGSSLMRISPPEAKKKYDLSDQGDFDTALESLISIISREGSQGS
jgi:hypothetical protein